MLHSRRFDSAATHLDALEAEAIHIFREVAANFAKPVMLYSVGKDSAVLMHLAMKAFFPAKPPFPFLHVDTTWKFREMIAFRDRVAKERDIQLIVHVNEDGVRQGINPIEHGSSVHTYVMKTMALRQALDTHGFDAAFGGARRDEEKESCQGAHLFLPRRQPRLGPQEPAPGNVEHFQYLRGAGRVRSGFSRLSNWTELDVWQYILRENIEIVPLYLAAPRPVVAARRHADHGR